MENKSIPEGINNLLQAMCKAKEEMQNLPNQYVVAYYRTKDESLIGYHLSTMCQVTKDIFTAKRYNGDNPYPQLEIISKNLKYVLQEEHTGFMAEAFDKIRDEDFSGMHAGDVYMDALYLNEDMPKQCFKFDII